MPRKKKPSVDYEVGYGRPPKATRFKPGQSGNPKGRTPGHANLATYLQDELRRTVSITENGRRRKVTKAEVLAKAAVNGALKGESKAFVNLMTLLTRAGLIEPPPPVESNEITPDDVEILTDFLCRQDPLNPEAGSGTDNSTKP